MNTWWDGNKSENLWIEITDRSDLGKNIIAPLRAQKGKLTPGYELLNHVKEGDVVLHWWMRPKNKINRGIYGYSTVVGGMQKGEIPWKSRGRYANSEPKGAKPATFWNLSEFTEFEKPILIGDINSKKKEILQLLFDLEKGYSRPIYFPFCKRKDNLAVNQTYFAKFPADLLKIIGIDVLSSITREIKIAGNSEPSISKLNKRLTTGFSRQSDPLKRIAVEKYAENIIFKYLVDAGYEVERFGKPFDLLAIKGEEIVKVEVKGKQEFATSVEVTVNEVEVAKNQSKEYRTLFAVVDNISMRKEGDSWVCDGGRQRLWWDLPLSEESLYATRFRYTLPDE